MKSLGKATPEPLRVWQKVFFSFAVFLVFVFPSHYGICDGDLSRSSTCIQMVLNFSTLQRKDGILWEVGSFGEKVHIVTKMVKVNFASRLLGVRVAFAWNWTTKGTSLEEVMPKTVLLYLELRWPHYSYEIWASWCYGVRVYDDLPNTYQLELHI